MRAEYEKVIRKFSTENLKKKFPDRPDIQDAASTWVSRTDLNALLDANEANGLRIYYGCFYEKTNDDPKLDCNGLHSLIFVATKDSINPENPTTQNSRDQLNETTTNIDATSSYEGVAGTEDAVCPPHCETPPPGPGE